MTRKITALMAVVAIPMLAACGDPDAAGQGAAVGQEASDQESAVEGASGTNAVAQGGSQDQSWNFDDVAAGNLPPGWRIEQTNPRGQGAEWSVQRSVQPDEAAPSGSQVLALTNTRDATGSTFNLAWTDEIQFGDGRIEVKVKAGTGREDQGGGPIWRAQDKDNYYIARWNPLEDNFRLYHVENSRRTQLESADVDLSPDEWHTIAIEHQANQITAYLDGEMMFETTDDTFSQAGGVGVWTKADAATMFDDLVVTGGGAP